MDVEKLAEVFWPDDMKVSINLWFDAVRMNRDFEVGSNLSTVFRIFFSSPLFRPILMYFFVYLRRNIEYVELI